MGASDLPLHVRQRIESKWSARVRREDLQRATVVAEALAGESRWAKSLEQGERAGIEPSSETQEHLHATFGEAASVTDDSTSA
jgi:hypothetical protein